MPLPPSTVTVRRADPDDAATLASLGAATFTETFGHLYPRQDLQTFLEGSHSVAAWTRRLNDPHGAIWIAQSSEGDPIGLVAVGACKLPVQNLEVSAGEVQLLYVLASHHNLKLGTQLMQTGMQWLEAQGRQPLYLGVWSENYGAQRFYHRYGFATVGEYGFPVGETIDREFILRR